MNGYHSLNHVQELFGYENSNPDLKSIFNCSNLYSPPQPLLNQNFNLTIPQVCLLKNLYNSYYLNSYISAFHQGLSLNQTAPETRVDGENSVNSNCVVRNNKKVYSTVYDRTFYLGKKRDSLEIINTKEMKKRGSKFRGVSKNGNQWQVNDDLTLRF